MNARDRVRNKVEARIEHLIRLGKPFVTKDVQTPEIWAMAAAMTVEERYGKDEMAFVGIMANNVIKKHRFDGKLWRRYDLTAEKFETKGASYVYYPSNDRERFHLGAGEQFTPHRLTPNSKELRAEAEPPLRIIEPPADEQPQPPVEQPPRKRPDYRAIALALGGTVRMLLAELDALVEEMEHEDIPGGSDAGQA